MFCRPFYRVLISFQILNHMHLPAMVMFMLVEYVTVLCGKRNDLICECFQQIEDIDGNKLYGIE